MTIKIQLCGFFAVIGPDGKSLRPKGKKPASLLAYLSYLRGKGVTRDRLIDLFWSDRGQKQGQDSLRQSIYAIRISLGPELSSIITSDRSYIVLDPEQIEFDLWRSDGSINENISDSLLEDLDHISPEFDDWLMQTRSEVRNRQITRAERILAGLDPRAAPNEALQVATTILTLDRTNEPAARTAIMIHANRNELGHARRIFKNIQKNLQKYDLEISENTLNIYQKIKSASSVNFSQPQHRRAKYIHDDDGDVPLVEVAIRRALGGKTNQYGHSEEFFDQLISRMAQMPELRVRVLGDRKEPNNTGYRLSLVPTVNKNETRIILRLNSGNDEALWAFRSSVTLHATDEQIAAQVDKVLTQIPPAIEENTYRRINGAPETAYEHYVVAQRLFLAPPDEDYMERVVEHLEHAIDLKPDFLPAIQRLVKFYNTGSFMSRPGTDHTEPRKKAYQLAQRLLFLDSRYPTAHVRMTSCLLWQGKFKSAERSARKAMELKPYDPYALNVLATALVYLGELNLAERYYDMARERLLHDMDFLRTDYGELFYLKGEFQTALSWLETLEVRTPYRTLFWRAPTFAQMGRLPEARDDVEKMIEDLRKRWRGPEPFQAESGIQWMCDMKPYRRACDRDLLVDGFNKAGVKITAKNFP